MLIVNGEPVECFTLAWDPEFFARRRVVVGSTAFQCYFEVLAMLLAAEKWCKGSETTAILGDSIHRCA